MDVVAVASVTLRVSPSLCPAQRHHPFMGLGQQRPCRARAGREDTGTETGLWGAKGSSASEGTRCFDLILVL